MTGRELVIQRLKDTIDVKKSIAGDNELINRMIVLADEIVAVIRRGNKLVLCGNGGSASDALHFAGEIVGRFQKERTAWSAVVLNADVATMTAIANDYGFDDIFARQVQGHIRLGDLFIGISTSGNSENIFRAAKMARECGAKTGAILGKDGGRIKDCVDFPIVVKCNTTARVQESHICIIHILCELAEDALAGN